MDLRNPDHIDMFIHATRFINGTNRLNTAAEHLNGGMTWAQSFEGHVFWNAIHLKLKMYSQLLELRGRVLHNEHFDPMEREHHEVLDDDAREWLTLMTRRVNTTVENYNAGVPAELQMSVDVMFGIE